MPNRKQWADVETANLGYNRVKLAEGQFLKVRNLLHLLPRRMDHRRRRRRCLPETSIGVNNQVNYLFRFFQGCYHHRRSEKMKRKRHIFKSGGCFRVAANA